MMRLKPQIHDTGPLCRAFFSAVHVIHGIATGSLIAISHASRNHHQATASHLVQAKHGGRQPRRVILRRFWLNEGGTCCNVPLPALRRRLLTADLLMPRTMCSRPTRECKSNRRLEEQSPSQGSCVAAVCQIGRIQQTIRQLVPKFLHGLIRLAVDACALDQGEGNGRRRRASEASSTPASTLSVCRAR